MRSLCRRLRPHGIFSEAIQFDVATKEGAGGDPNVNASVFGKDLFDGAGTQNATIKNCYFGPEKNGLSGGAMINGLDKKFTFPYGASVGSHSINEITKKSNYKNLNVTGSTFENTAVATNTTAAYYKHMAPIHYRYSAIDKASDINTLKASNNTFINVLDRRDSGIPDTLDGQNRPLYKKDLGLHKAWFRNAPEYLATVSNGFPKMNANGSKYTKAVLAHPAKKAAKKAPAKKTTAKKTSKKAPAKKTTAKKTSKKAPAKKTTVKKTSKKAPAKKTVAKKSSKKAPAKKTAAKKSSKKKSTKKKTTKKAAKKSSKKSSKKTSKKK